MLITSKETSFKLGRKSEYGDLDTNYINVCNRFKTILVDHLK